VKIINETCYNTEDLESLFEKVQSSVQESEEPWKNQNGMTLYPHDPPASVRIGYYKPSTEKCRWSGERNYINKTGWGDDVRLGIVRPSALGVSPLVALAQAADGANLRLPTDVVKLLVKSFCGLITYASLLETRNLATLWSWVDSFEIRYRARAKRGSRAEVKRARDLAKVTKLKSKIVNSGYSITTLENQLSSAKHDLNLHKNELVKMKNDLGV